MIVEEKKMLNIKMLGREIASWKKEAKRRDLFLGQFVRFCVKEELRRKKSLVENGAGTSVRTVGRRERVQGTTA
jgi:hypothetical protein